MNFIHFPKFSGPARKFWEAIPEHVHNELPANVWCGQCRCSTTIVSYQGTVKSGNLILTGECKVCGADVARLIEGI
jgi:transcription elongation factor Elf1